MDAATVVSAGLIGAWVGAGLAVLGIAMLSRGTQADCWENAFNQGFEKGFEKGRKSVIDIRTPYAPLQQRPAPIPDPDRGAGRAT